MPCKCDAIDSFDSSQAEAHVLRFLYEALHQGPTAISLISQYPNTWLPQSTANTELFEVNLNSLEARPLVQAVQAAGATVVKVCTLHSAHQHAHCSSAYKLTCKQLLDTQMAAIPRAVADLLCASPTVLLYRCT